MEFHFEKKLNTQVEYTQMNKKKKEKKKEKKIINKYSE